MKKFTLFLGLCLPLLMVAQGTTGKVMLGGKPSVFESRIHAKEIVDPDEDKKHAPEQELATQWEKQLETMKAGKKNKFRFLSARQIMQQAQGYRARNVLERLDSVVTRDGKNNSEGDFISKQIFDYDESYRPLTCINYMYNNVTDSWDYYGEYGYEWTDEGHCAAVWEVNGMDGSLKYEYIYGNGGALYTQQIYYTYQDGEWIPAQMAEYGFDDAGNTIEELYYLYNADAGEWSKAQKVTATYDEHGWITSMFTYLWNESKADWVGTGTGYRWEYIDNGEENLRVEHIWDGNDWMAYCKYVKTYDENYRVTQTEWQYWNAENQDWRGGYVGPNGATYNNSKTVYYFDEQGRTVRYETYRRTASQDYSTYYTYSTIDYSMLENGEEKEVACTYSNIGAGIELYKRFTEHHIAAASAYTYYLSEQKFNAGSDKMTKLEEQFRYIDENGLYHGSESYAFTYDDANSRYGSSKEEITYDEEGRQTGAHHWRGRRLNATEWEWYDHDDWVVYNIDGYDGNVVAGYDVFYYSGDNKLPDIGYYNIFDFTMRPENLIRLITPEKSDTYKKYKYLEAYTYENLNYGTNNDPNLFEYTDFYYYTEAEKLPGGWNEDGTPIVLAHRLGKSMKALQASNGEIYVGWTGSADGGTSGYMQLVDNEGYNVYGQEGLTVNTLSNSGHNSLMGMAIDTENNIVVSFPDARDGSNLWSTKPYAYKIGNNVGDQLWTAAGIEIPSSVGNNIVQSVVGKDNHFYVIFSDAYDYTYHTHYVNRLDGDGGLAWEESKVLPGAFASLVSSGDNWLAVYSSDNKVYAQLFNDDLEALLSEPQLISGDVVISSLPYSGSLFNYQSDGNGGMIVAFADATYNGKYYIQHIGADGKASMVQPFLLNADQAIGGVKYYVDVDRQQVALFYQAGDYSGYSLNMQVVNFDGTSAVHEKIITTGGIGYTVSGVSSVNGEYIVAYVKSVDYSNTEQYVARIDVVNRKVYGEKVGTNAVSSCTDVIFNDNILYYFWGFSKLDETTWTANNEIQGIRYNLDDIITEMGDLQSAAVDEITVDQANGDGAAYDLQGRRVNADNAQGIIIVNGKKILKR